MLLTFPHPVAEPRPLPVAPHRSAHRRLRATFQSPRLEKDFLKYCQLSSEQSELPLTCPNFRLLTERVEKFIDSPDFCVGSAEKAILGETLLADCAPPQVDTRPTKPTTLPPHLASLCEAHLLTSEQERQLFQRMNFVRYRANQILAAHSAQTLDQWDLERVQGLLRVADWYRDRIVKSNVRLVISIVKKFVNPQCTFDDLLSDGIMALLRSVEKFDYQLGFRFSTYATQVVRRHSYRFVMDRQDDRFRNANTIHDPGLDLAQDEEGSTLNETRWQELRHHLGGLLTQLDRREKFIIRARFSLGGHRRVQTLQKIADRLGISKERVRQLEKRALEKLQQMASAHPPQFADVDF